MALGENASQLPARLLATAPDPALAQASTSASMDELMEEIGFGRFHALLMVFCGMAWFMDAVEVMGLPYIYVELDKEWGTNTEDWAVKSSVCNVSGLLGSLFFGALADKCGRRPALLAALALTTLGGLASAASPNFLTLVTLRATTNVGAGGALPVAISLLVEHFPPSTRESCLVLMQVFFLMGNVLAIVAAMVLPSSAGMWRTFMVVMALPATLLLLASSVVPESPVFLHQSGNEAGAREALRGICRVNRKSCDIVRLPERVQEGAPVQGKQATGIVRLLSSRRVACQALLFSFLWALTMTASDYTNWMTELGNERGFAQHTVDRFMILCKAVGLAAFLAAAACARGSRGCAVLCAGYAGGALASAAATAAAATSAPPGPTLLPPSVVLLCFPYDIVWSLLYAVTAMRFDPLCRASALSIANGSSSLAGAATPLASGVLLAAAGTAGLPAMLFWSASWAASACLAFALLCRCKCRATTAGVCS